MDVITLNSSGGGNRLSHQQIDQLASGGAKLKMPRVIGFETPRSMKLSPDERRALEDAKRSGYYYAKPDKVVTLAFYWFETANLPPIEIKAGPKLASITMDIVSIRRAVQERWETHPQLEDRMAALARRYGGRVKSATSFNWIDRVPSSRADECASALRALWDELTRASS